MTIYISKNDVDMIILVLSILNIAFNIFSTAVFSETADDDKQKIFCNVMLVVFAIELAGIIGMFVLVPRL